MENPLRFKRMLSHSTAEKVVGLGGIRVETDVEYDRTVPLKNTEIITATVSKPPTLSSISTARSLVTVLLIFELTLVSTSPLKPS